MCRITFYSSDFLWINFLSNSMLVLNLENQKDYLPFKVDTELTVTTG